MSDGEKKKSIIICEYISTGINYVDDAFARGYTPVLVEGHYVGTPEVVAPFVEERETINRRMKDRVKIIPEQENYEDLLRLVKECDPAVVVAGSEFGVAIAAKLAADLGLKGNPVDRIDAMTQKDAMQQALRDHGIRSIRSKVVSSEEEASAFYKELCATGKTNVVVKPARGAGSTGVYLCGSEEEMLFAVRKHFDEMAANNITDFRIMVQEQIIGTEYVVNTVSCAGKHRVVSVGQYDKYKLSNGSNAYNYFRYVSKLGVGHSALLRYACQVADAIGIQYGPVHGEYMVDEEGPVLIEVNCRPMGGGLERKYSELVSGQHETDSALDSYLDPIKFHLESLRPYRLKRYGASKDIVFTSDTEILSAPMLQICKRLKSYYSASFIMIGKTSAVRQTSDMDTEAGLIYLLHDDEQQVKDDCDLLHLLELKYPMMLYQGASTWEVPDVPDCDLAKLMKDASCHGSTLVFTDKEREVEGAEVVNERTLRKAYDSYEQGILDITDQNTFADLESVIQQIFMFMDKVRAGGRIIIPESTYTKMPYGMEGMEILLKVHGDVIELPAANDPSLLIAMRQEN